MNELNKLIEQYERENPGKKARIEYNGGVFYRWSTYFVQWLVSRPTCGKEQRKFLDEVEKSPGDYLLYDSEFTLASNNIDIHKVIKGE